MAANRYIEALLILIEGFKYELCHECGRDIDEHIISADMFGLPHAWCAPVNAERLEA